MKFKTKLRGFTLIEMLLALTGFLVIIVIVIGIYIRIINIRDDIDARQNLIQESYFTLEKLNILLRDFTIDYEEYFNRSMIGCDTGGATFSWDIGDNGHCDLFTNYGNGSNINLSYSGSFSLYYCSSYGAEDFPLPIYTGYGDGYIWTGCAISGYQSFGEYSRQFRDMKKDRDTVQGVVNDEDDDDVGFGPEAILNATGVKELYLISQDNKQRIFFRRALIDSGDWNKDGTISGDTEKRYNIQVLKLKGFDAGSNHNFDITTSSGIYDGVIDTRACDYSLGFRCNGQDIGPAYTGYNLPSDPDDGRVNMFPKNITIADRNLIISPTKNPEYSRKEGFQINPYFTISINNKLYGEIWQWKIGKAIDNFNLNLQTTLSTKNFYTK
ncbi:MAG: hypothetical protein WAZ12_04295 [Candidatus Absconditicoccaceae bacterium]